MRSLGALAVAWALSANGAAAQTAPIKVACVGEHTTHSNLYQNDDREHQPVGMQEYPMKLQMLMGSGYDVRNFGDCCASVVQGYPSSETHPYVSGGNYKNAVAFAPDIVVIGSWGRHDWGLSAMTAFDVFTVEKFQADYEDMVKKFLALPSKPKVFCSLPIPILFGEDGPDRGFATTPAVNAIKAVAAKYDLPTVDLFSAFLHQMSLYINPPLKDSEGEHASDAGLQKIADLVAAALKADAMGGAGGDAATGGMGGAGGTPDAATGGTGGAGGTPDAATGGTGGTGGTPDAATGGTGGTGGAASATGGTSGAAGTGGGPIPGTGGVDGTGGEPGSGGAPAEGTGGAMATGTGGSVTSGAGTGGANTTPPDNMTATGGSAAGRATGDAGGCAVVGVGSEEPVPWGGLPVAGLLGLAMLRRRRTGSRRGSRI